MAKGSGRLFCFGLGFSARVLAGRLLAQGWQVAGTTRSREKAERLSRDGIEGHVYDGVLPVGAQAFHGASHILIGIPPDEGGDAVLRHHGGILASLDPAPEWIGYLSTTGVYGDRQGGWVDESSDLRPAGERGRRRMMAERQWLDFGTEHHLSVHVFRLAGIYGPGRNPLTGVREGTAKRIDKPGQVFSRIHVEDIAGVLAASMARPHAGGIYNVCDDEPAPPADVVTYACELLGVAPPPLIPFEEAAKDMSPMGRSFYAESKRCRNDRIKQELGVKLAYPTYREGLRALFEAGEGRA